LYSFYSLTIGLEQPLESLNNTLIPPIRWPIRTELGDPTNGTTTKRCSTDGSGTAGYRTARWPFSLTLGSAYAQQKLGDGWLVEARALAEALNDPHDLEIVKEVLLLCVLHS
jgi:hypothetical protein